MSFLRSNARYDGVCGVSMEALQEKSVDFEAICRKAGLKVTRQRLEIYQELVRSTDHPTAEALHRRLRRNLPNLSLDTVYRTLATFAHHGLISRVETAESLSRFEATFARHHHLICRRCGKISDFSWPHLDDVSLPPDVSDWGNIDSKNIVIYGICGQCLNELPEKI
ncbi:MAG: Peroxide-responsive repressor PerR [Syntrophus sp. PtaU1.Bin005]|nr:MAG: Peroxide-responsive repressor PerR [Syntrophus sp. PtaU1.Bin005]